MSKPCEYCGVDLPLGVDKRTRRVRSFHFASCEKRPQQTTLHSPDIEAQRDALRESHPYPMHVRLAADELVWLFEARERDKVAFKQLQAQRDALLEALKEVVAFTGAHGGPYAQARAAIKAVEGEKS